uniref:Uncharacterized protein n=1 Tax=viral metagenome TaxID=1070528 RepID=A0A6M3JKD3_9ZZZZ
MERSPSKKVNRKKDTQLKENKITNRIRSLKMKVLDMEGKLDNLESIVRSEIKEAYGDLIKKSVNRKVLKEAEIVQRQIMTRVYNGYLDFMEEIADNQMKVIIERKIRFEIRSFKSSEFKVENINKMYKDGWRICYSGKLTPDGETMILFDRPIFLDKKKKNEKNSEKKKVKRNPA